MLFLLSRGPIRNYLEYGEKGGPQGEPPIEPPRRRCECLGSPRASLESPAKKIRGLLGEPRNLIGGLRTFQEA